MNFSGFNQFGGLLTKGTVVCPFISNTQRAEGLVALSFLSVEGSFGINWFYSCISREAKLKISFCIEGSCYHLIGSHFEFAGKKARR